jgi:HEAT repeat protein
MSPIENYLAEFSDPDTPVMPSKLVNLSDLSPEELATFQDQWPEIETGRRRQIVALLAELAADNLELDFDEVFRVCLADPDGEVRCAAIEGLEQCEDRSLIEPLIDLLAEDSDPMVRTAAAAALGRFALLAELGKLPVEDASRVERALLTSMGRLDEHLDVYCSSLEAVSPLSKPHVEELIREAYRSDSLEFRASALCAMGRNCNPDWLPILLKELRSSHVQLRLEAARACAELEAEEAVPRLTELLDDREVNVQVRAIEALGAIGGQLARQRLEQCAEGDDDILREAAEKALEQLGFWEDPMDI